MRIIVILKRAFMRKIGFIILSIGLVALAIMCGIAKLIMHVDSLNGEYNTNWITYVEYELLLIAFVMILGIFLGFTNKKG